MAWSRNLETLFFPLCHSSNFHLPQEGIMPVCHKDKMKVSSSSILQQAACCIDGFNSIHFHSICFSSEELLEAYSLSNFTTFDLKSETRYFHLAFLGMFVTELQCHIKQNVVLVCIVSSLCYHALRLCRVTCQLSSFISFEIN